MKHINLAFVLTFSMSQAATITLQTNAFVANEADVKPVEFSSVISIGTYAADPTFAGAPTKTEAVDTYMELGFGLLDSINDLDGFFRFDLDVLIPNSFNNKQIYMVIGNGVDIASSDELLIWKPTANPEGNFFVEDNPTGGPGVLTLNNTTGSLLLGSFDGEFNMSSVATIPEPSSLALSGLALFALAGRRNRK